MAGGGICSTSTLLIAIGNVIYACGLIEELPLKAENEAQVLDVHDGNYQQGGLSTLLPAT